MGNYYYIGGERQTVNAVSDANVGDNTTLATTDVRGSVYVPTSNSFFTCAFLDPATGGPIGLTNFWVHFQHQGLDSNGNVCFELIDASGTAWLRLYSPGNWVQKFQVWNGTAWSDLGGATVSFDYNTAHTVDLQITISNPGFANIWLDGRQVVYFNGDVSAAQPVYGMRFHGNDPSHSAEYSQIIVSDSMTVGHRVRMKPPSGNGDETQWGDYSNVNAFPAQSTNLVTANASGMAQTYGHQTFSDTPSGMAVKAVAVATYITTSVTGPQNASLRLRLGGTDYDSPSVLPIVAGQFDGRIAIWQTDPSTGQPWAGVTNLNNGQFGIVSKD